MAKRNEAPRAADGQIGAGHVQGLEAQARALDAAIAEAIAHDLQQARDLAWAGQHDQAIALCTQALAARPLATALQIELLDRRAESLIALGRFDDAAADGALMRRRAAAAIIGRGRAAVGAGGPGA